MYDTGNSSLHSTFYRNNNSNYNGNSESSVEFLYFSTIGTQQLLNNPPPTLGYAKNYHVLDNDLLYKIFRGDTKLVRSLLEANNFSHTESHEWNILWSSGSCKSYLYEGLNEF